MFKRKKFSTKSIKLTRQPEGTHNFKISLNEELINDEDKRREYFDNKFKFEENSDNKIYSTYDPDFLNIIKSGKLGDYYKEKNIQGPKSETIIKLERTDEDIQNEYLEYLNKYKEVSGKYELTVV
jgi:hypothetical protein